MSAVLASSLPVGTRCFWPVDYGHGRTDTIRGRVAAHTTEGRAVIETDDGRHLLMFKDAFIHEEVTA